MKDTIEKLVEDMFMHQDKQKAIIQLMALMGVRNNSKPTCTDCKSEDVTKSGSYQSTGKDSGDFYGCNDCGKEFDVQRYYELEFSDKEKTMRKSYTEELDEYEDQFDCNDCSNIGRENFIYNRTVANGEEWKCKECKKETIFNEEPIDY